MLRRTSTSRFQSTSSVWRTTRRITEQGLAALISIHVLRVEDDVPGKSTA